MGKSLKTFEQRFWEKVEFTEYCWNWVACRHKDGHGKIGKNGKTFYAHRIAYELLVGPIPDGLVLDHICRNTSCVNPIHLEPVTQKINTNRGISPPALQLLITHCPLGHEYNEENTYHWRGHRRCRICNAIKAKEYRDRVKP
jgi:hypothetical protein